MSINPNLDEAKKLTQVYLQTKLEVEEKLATLNDMEMKEYDYWFRNNPLFIEMPKRMAGLFALRNKNNL